MALFSSIKMKRPLVIEEFAEKDTNITVKTLYGDTFLHVAVYCRNAEALRALLKLGLDPSEKNIRGVTPLWYAADMGDAILISDLKQNGANMQVVDSKNNSLLHLAARKGHEEVTRFLLDSGMFIDSRNIYLETPLHVATVNQKENIVRILLGNRAMVNARDEIGSTALHYAALNGNVNIPRILLNHKADINLKDKYGATALHGAAHGGHSHVLHLLLQNGASVERAANSSWSPLHVAAAKGNLDSIVILINAGFNVNQEATDGTTPLHFAVTEQREAVVEELLARGA